MRAALARLLAGFIGTEIDGRSRWWSLVATNGGRFFSWRRAAKIKATIMATIRVIDGEETEEGA